MRSKAMKDLSMAVLAAGLGVLLAVSFGMFLVIVMSLHMAALVATAGAFILVFALGLYAGARCVTANDDLPESGFLKRAG